MNFINNFFRGKTSDLELNQHNSWKISRKPPLCIVDPKQVFEKYDTDGSGKISWEEFAAMLPDLGINISEAKAKKYFSLCDTDGSCLIDFDEFQVALYICDPITGNNLGFEPHSLLSPQDAFEMFDTDGNGKLDEDEFFYLLQYMGLEVDDQTQESMFKKYDRDRSGYIEYSEFRKIWVRVSNTKQELIDRGISLPTFHTKISLFRQLEKVLDYEEECERRVVEEAERWRKWQSSMKVKREMIARARELADAQLAAALDVAGQLYVFGEGTQGQFNAKPTTSMSSDFFEQEGCDRIQQLWIKRSSLVGANPNTAMLWGRCPIDITISENVMFALTESGEVFCWGGAAHYWHQIEVDSHWQTHWRGDTTTRSQMLLATEQLTEPTLFGGDENMDKARELEKLIRILKYFDKWQSVAGYDDPLSFINQNLVPRLDYEEMQLALRLRGKSFNGLTKYEMINYLNDDIVLEQMYKGEAFHLKQRELEKEIKQLTNEGRLGIANRLSLEAIESWRPVRDHQLQEQRSLIRMREVQEKEERKRLDLLFESWHNHSQEGRLVTDRVDINGITLGGPGFKSTRSTTSLIFAGSNHVGLVDKLGRLFTWGVGCSGRLGLGNQSNTSMNDAGQPTIVQALRGYSVVNGSCGFSHTAVVCSSGEMFVWGNACNGKLGLGPLKSDAKEFLASLPTPLFLPNARKVIKVSCGANHTAGISEEGKLFTWGCNDGGRLGLGEDMVGKSQFTPRLVESLRHEVIVDVSCGCYQTISISKIKNINKESAQSFEGGRLYVAGPATVLGKYCPKFQFYNCLDSIPITQVATGYLHQLALSVKGDIFSWGYNHAGCCLHEKDTYFLTEPTLVKNIFPPPKNLALLKPCKQSSVYGGLDAGNAVDGNLDGCEHSLVHTQIDPQPYWECDLGNEFMVERIKLWNRTDTPSDKHVERDKFTRRLFPCWLIISRRPFSSQIGGNSLKSSLEICTAKVRIVEKKRVTEWVLPAKSIGRYVRVQLESYSTLHFAQVQVFGFEKESFGKVHKISAGKNVSSLIVKYSNNPKTDAYRMISRAKSVDNFNCNILRTFKYFTDAYYHIKKSAELRCAICADIDKPNCHVCALKSHYERELTEGFGENFSERSLDEISSFLMDSSRSSIFKTEEDKKA